MDGPSARPERARKRGRLSQHFDQPTVAEAAQRRTLPKSRITRQERYSHRAAARGGSPTRIDRNTTFSHATLPALQNFGDLSVASAGTTPIEPNFPALFSGPGVMLSQADESTVIPHDLLYHELEAADDLSGASGTSEWLHPSHHLFFNSRTVKRRLFSPGTPF